MLCAHNVVFDSKLEVAFDDDESVMSLMQDCLQWNETCIEEGLNERLEAC